MDVEDPQLVDLAGALLVPGECTGADPPAGEVALVAGREHIGPGDDVDTGGDRQRQVPSRVPIEDDVGRRGGVASGLVGQGGGLGWPPSASITGYWVGPPTNPYSRSRFTIRSPDPHDWKSLEKRVTPS